MANYIASNEKFHVFSKAPITSTQALAQSVNKSGHTTTTSDVWSQDIPWFFTTDSKANAIKYSKNAKTNDLVDINGVVYKRKDTKEAPYNAEGSFESMWDSYPLSNGLILQNSEGKGVIKVHQGVEATLLTTANNANQSSYSAARIWVGGQLIPQFVQSTDKIVDGFPATGYGVSLWNNGTPISEGEAAGNFIANSFAGIIQLNQDYSNPKFTANVFEYIGDKLDASISGLRQSIKDISDVTLKGVVASVTADEETAQKAGITVDNTVSTTPIIKFTAGSVATGEEKLVTGGAVFSVTDALSSRIAQLEGIQHFSVEIVPEGQTIENVTPLVENTIYLVKDANAADGSYIEYIAFKQGEETKVERIGTTAIDLEGYTTDAEHTALANRVTALDAATTGRVAVVESEISTIKTTTIPAAITEAKGYTDTTLSDALKDGGSIAQKIAEAKQAAIDGAKVTLTAGTGITIPNSGTQQTAFTVSVDTDVIATKTSVDDLSDVVSGISQVVASNKTEIDGKISVIEGQLGATGATGQAIQAAQDAADAAQDTADEAKGIAETAVQTVAKAEGSSSLLTVTQSGTAVTVGLADTVATKSDITSEINKLSDANGAITTLDGRVDAIETSLAAGGETAEAIVAAKKAGTDASDALNTAKGQSLAQTGTLTGMFSVATEGTVGTGITNITIEDKGLSTAISNARTNAVADVKALTFNASDSDDAAKVTVTLGGTVETPKITVTSSDIASAQTLSELSSKVNTHIEEAAGLYLSVKKVDVLPADSEAKSNMIYLVPVDTDAGREQNIHTEYIWTNGQWEVIGTTAIDMNSLEAAAKAAQDAADKAQGEVDAVEEAIAAMDATETVNGLTVTQVDGKITGLSETLITASVPEGTTSVEGNVAYVGTTKHVIAPEKFQTAAQMPSTLTSWVADLSNLTVGDNMFKGCTGLTVFVGDLSSLTSAVEMFNGCTLDKESLEILAENLPTVTSGTIDIGAQTNAPAEVIATIKNKKWTVKSNGTAL